MEKRYRFVSSDRLPLLLLAALLTLVVYTALLQPAFFEDDRYNLGVVRRSVLPEARSFLETSIVHVFFEPYPMPRPEDWHRGLSIVLLVLWARAVGSGNEMLLRVPHLIWIGLWLLLALCLCRLLDPPTQQRTARTMRWQATALLGFLVLTPWSQPIFRRAFLDDVPAAVCVLLMLLLLARASSYRLSLAALAGVLGGIAFFMKDFYILWGPLGAFLVAAGPVGESSSFQLKSSLSRAVVFALAFTLAAVPKPAWSYIDLGATTGNLSQYSIAANYFGTPPVDEHYPFFLHGDGSYRSRIDLAGGVLPALGKVLRSPSSDLRRALGDLSFAWLWLVPIALPSSRVVHWSGAHCRLSLTLLVSALAYSSFFWLGMGEATQMRYWIVPVTLAAVLAVNQVFGLLAAPPWQASRPRIVLGVLALVFFLVFFHLRPAELILNLRGELPQPVSDAVAQRLSAELPGDQAVLIETARSFYYWSLHPEDRVVALPAKQLVRLGDEAVERLFDTYRVGYALYSDGEAIARLKTRGFAEIDRVGDQALLKRGSHG
ncbi:MAG: hypothetical protein HY331_04960 [Chloroflexi bacterium]|nr:hypothetical protein [Chloroflexota bacterium]